MDTGPHDACRSMRIEGKDYPLDFVRVHLCDQLGLYFDKPSAQLRPDVGAEHLRVA